MLLMNFQSEGMLLEIERNEKSTFETTNVCKTNASYIQINSKALQNETKFVS